MDGRRMPILSAWLGVEIYRGSNWPSLPWRRKRDETRVMMFLKAPIRVVRLVTGGARARLLALKLVRRWKSRPILRGPKGEGITTSGGSAYGIGRCDIAYINLAHRTDRREHFEGQMKMLGVSRFTRIEAARANPGILGCGMSHGQALRWWEPSEKRLLVVCEDDATFKTSRLALDVAVEEFYRHPGLSVLCLGNNPSHVVPISEQLGISADIQTTSCYAVKPEAVGAIADAAERSVHMLRAGVRVRRAAIDVVWKSVQKEFFFAVPLDQMVEQLPGYSDIERSHTNYGI